MSKKTVYTVSIKTAESKQTESAFITIHGDKSSVEKHPLNENKAKSQLFKSNAVDQFEIQASDLGKIKKIVVGHNGKGSWKVDTVDIQGPSGKSSFKVNKVLEGKSSQAEVGSSDGGEAKKANEPKKSEEQSKQSNEKAAANKKPAGEENKKKQPNDNENKKKDNEKKKKDGNESDHDNDEREKSPRRDANVEELKRIKHMIEEESNKSKYNRRKENQPFVFNDLYPYFDVKVLEKSIYSDDRLHPCEYHTRYTASGIIEPWVAHRMEHSLSYTPAIEKKQSPRKKEPKNHDEHPDAQRPDKNQLNGSTLAPNFPRIQIKKPKSLVGPFYYDDVKTIRKELKKNMENKNRFEEDRNRTINDYYRMNLDQVGDKEKMSSTYRAYLENTPGSKKALEELLSNQITKKE